MTNSNIPNNIEQDWAGGLPNLIHDLLQELTTLDKVAASSAHATGLNTQTSLIRQELHSLLTHPFVQEQIQIAESIGVAEDYQERNTIDPRC